jgi:hypothetical protein
MTDPIRSGPAAVRLGRMLLHRELRPTIVIELLVSAAV